MALECLAAGLLVADHVCAPLERMPRPGELLLTDQLVLNIGGCAANTAVDLARVGVNTAIAGCVGDDYLGKFVSETLEAAGVQTAALQRLGNIHTAGTLIVNVAAEDRRYIHTLGANQFMSVEHIPQSLLPEIQVLYLGGYLLLDAMQPEELVTLFRTAKSHGVRTVVDVVVPGPGDYWQRLRPVLAETDVFLPNSDEGREILGIEDPIEQAQRFHDAGAKTVVVTCGEEGTILIDETQRLWAKSFPVDVLDGSGAGDAFDAGYIAGLIAGEDTIGCLRWGSTLGASCVRAIGTTAGVFTRPEALEFMNENPLQIEPI